MKVFRSIRWRLQFWHALLLALVLAGFGLSAYEIERAGLARSTDAELDRRADTLARAVHPPPPPAGRDDLPGDDFAGPPGPPEFHNPGESGPPPRRDRPRPGLPSLVLGDYAAEGPGQWYYVIWLRNGPPVTRSPNGPADVPRPPRPDSRLRGPALRVRGSFREAFLPLGPGDIVLVGHDVTADLQGLHRAAWAMAAAAGMILALGLLGGHWLAGRSLQPIADISAAAARIAAGRLDQRIGNRDTESELGQLAQVLDATFARLEAAFARQARFTADAAHELRTPLAVILTHAQHALAVPGAPEEHAEALAACQRAAQRMRALTEALLRLARLDSGAQPPDPVRFDLAGRVADCVGLIGPLAARRGIAVKADLNAAECAGDPGQIDQVITNLLTNAIEHNVENGEIRVSTRAACGRATLTVADSGPGIAAAHLPHVFERFYRADASRSRSSGGVGLGLAIARAIVEAHGGSIQAASEPGRGAVFTVSLPSLS